MFQGTELRPVLNYFVVGGSLCNPMAWASGVAEVKGREGDRRPGMGTG